MKLIVDNREKLKDLFSENINIEYKNLDIGDYLIEKDQDNSIIVERKTEKIMQPLYVMVEIENKKNE